ncbi:cytochrome b5-like heme/steroid binding domain-containing protein [Obelidium mucronatum]|nr:cytochrome b5-like heme/steroid binding domain-containing protein [Obelidium mucronatum]
MFPPRIKVSIDVPRKGRPFTLAELACYNGADHDLAKPVLVALKGIVYDVSSSRELYAPGGQLHVFAGKESSKAVALSVKGGLSELVSGSAAKEGGSPVLGDEQLEVLENWVAFYELMYKEVGYIVTK